MFTFEFWCFYLIIAAHSLWYPIVRAMLDEKCYEGRSCIEDLLWRADWFGFLFLTSILITFVRPCAGVAEEVITYYEEKYKLTHQVFQSLKDKLVHLTLFRTHKKVGLQRVQKYPVNRLALFKVLNKIDRKFPKDSEYLRDLRGVGSTLSLRADQIQKLDHPANDISEDLLFVYEEEMNEIMATVKPHFICDEEFRRSIILQLDFDDHSFVEEDLSKSNGFGAPGKKKRDSREWAETRVTAHLKGDCDITEDHSWITTGRVKRKKTSEADAARLCCFPRHDVGMLGLRFDQPFYKAFANVRKFVEWGPGSSVVLDTQAEYTYFMRDYEQGDVFEDGDLSSFDFSLRGVLMDVAMQGMEYLFRCTADEELIRSASLIYGVDQSEIKRRLETILQSRWQAHQDMLYGEILFPGGWVVSKNGNGMNSGFSATALYDTLCHMAMRRAVDRFCFAKSFNTDILKQKAPACLVKARRITGDDQMGRVPKRFIEILSDENISEGYAAFGVKMRFHNYWSDIRDAEYCGKRFWLLSSGRVVKWRSLTDTLERIVYPDKPLFPMIFSAETETLDTILGHIIDNPMNAEWTQIAEEIVGEIVEEHELPLARVKLDRKLMYKTGIGMNVLYDLLTNTGITGYSVMKELWMLNESEIVEVERMCDFEMRERHYSIKQTDFSPALYVKPSRSSLYLDANETSTLFTIANEYSIEPIIFSRCAESSTLKSWEAAVEMQVKHAVRVSVDRGTVRDNVNIKAMRMVATPLGAGSRSGLRLTEALQVSALRGTLPRSIGRILSVGAHPGGNLRALRWSFPKVPIDGVSLVPPQDEPFSLAQDLSRVSLIEEEGLTFLRRMDKDVYDIIDIDAVVGEECGSYTVAIYGDGRKSPEAHLRLIKPMVNICLRKFPRALILLTLRGRSSMVDTFVHTLYRKCDFFEATHAVGSPQYSNLITVAVRRKCGDVGVPHMVFRRPFMPMWYGFLEEVAKRRVMWLGIRIAVYDLGGTYYNEIQQDYKKRSLILKKRLGTDFVTRPPWSMKGYIHKKAVLYGL